MKFIVKLKFHNDQDTWRPKNWMKGFMKPRIWQILYTKPIFDLHHTIFLNIP